MYTGEWGSHGQKMCIMSKYPFTNFSLPKIVSLHSLKKNWTCIIHSCMFYYVFFNFMPDLMQLMLIQCQVIMRSVSTVEFWGILIKLRKQIVLDQFLQFCNRYSRFVPYFVGKGITLKMLLIKASFSKRLIRIEEDAVDPSSWQEVERKILG